MNTTSINTVTPPPFSPESIPLRQVERDLDYRISRFGVAMDHLAEKIGGTSGFISRVTHMMDGPKQGIKNVRANPDPYIRKTLLVFAAVATIKVLFRDYEIVNPFQESKY